MSISKRVAGVAPSATVAITERAKALRAAGEDVIGFGAGEPDFPTPDHIVAAAREAAGDAANHRYTPTAGLPELRQAIATKTQRDSGYIIEPSQVLVTNGGKHAVYEACLTLLDPGDEVLLLAPYWVSYPEIVKLADAVPVEVFAGDEQGFLVTVDQLEAARTERTKLLVFVSPSNPTGAVYNPDQVEAIGRWAAEHGIWVLTDEIYEHLIYDEAVARSLPALVPELAERCVVVNGVAKSYAMTGWRVGWMIGPVEVVKAATKLQSQMTTNVANVSQRAAIAAVSDDLSATEAMRKAFDVRRQTMHRMLNEIDGVDCVEPNGAFYAFPNMNGLLGRPLAGRTAATTMELAELVLEEAKVAFVPGEPFGAPGYARFSYALGDDELVEGLGRLAVLVG
ncbi:MAG: pyridoxal phosphate-dependent aminotransferase [Acidimicrobiia bacterium]|nr:pyridoxal phosphate-dependent aminotransferase [Acidimicrobiia bacterium]